MRTGRNGAQTNGNELEQQGYAGNLSNKTRQSQRRGVAYWLRWASIIRPASQHTFFSDPAWDTLLELYVEWDQHCTVSYLASQTGVSASTIKRWLALLEQAGYVRGLADHDPCFTLSALGFETMNEYSDTLLSGMLRLKAPI